MKKLSRAELAQIAHQIQQAKPHQALQAELLDHIASQIEQRMSQGEAFSAAFGQVMQQANPQALTQLEQIYLQELPLRASSPTPMSARMALRTKRRLATRPFRYMLLSSVFTFLAFISFLVIVSRPLALPIGTFQTVWSAGLASFTGVFVWWWLARKRFKPKRLLTA